MSTRSPLFMLGSWDARGNLALSLLLSLEQNRGIRELVWTLLVRRKGGGGGKVGKGASLFSLIFPIIVVWEWTLCSDGFSVVFLASKGLGKWFRNSISQVEWRQHKWPSHFGLFTGALNCGEKNCRPSRRCRVRFRAKLANKCCQLEKRIVASKLRWFPVSYWRILPDIIVTKSELSGTSIKVAL